MNLSSPELKRGRSDRSPDPSSRTLHAVTDREARTRPAETRSSREPRGRQSLGATRRLLDPVGRIATVWVVSRLAIAAIVLVGGRRTEPLSDLGLLAFCSLAVVGIFVTYPSQARSSLPLSSRSKIEPRFWACSFGAAWLVAGWIQLNGASPPVLALSVCSVLVPVGWWAWSLVAERLLSAPESRVLVLGDGDVTSLVIERLNDHGNGRCRVIGRVSNSDEPMPITESPMLGHCSELPEILGEHAPDLLLVAFDGCGDAELLDTIRACDQRGVEIAIVPRLYQAVGQTSSVAMVGDMPMIQVPPLRIDRISQAFKRVADLGLGFVITLLLAPVMLVVAAAVMIDDGRPILYKQRRIGRGGKPFQILKFRSMCRDADQTLAVWRAAVTDGTMTIENAVALMKPEVDPRVTRIGRFLRATSLDELPQLLNVLHGSMSLVGPRPLCDFEVAALADWEQARHMVRPGITGSWQVQGRSTVGWRERMQLDYAYVRHWTGWNDLRILAATIPAVFRGDGAR